jgi:hypothetical protein
VVRAFAASRYRQAFADASAGVFIAVEAIGLVVALWITYRSYRRDDV